VREMDDKSHTQDICEISSSHSGEYEAQSHGPDDGGSTHL
jgi:hypothetical protein